MSITMGSKPTVHQLIGGYTNEQYIFLKGMGDSHHIYKWMNLENSLIIEGNQI
jgi:hypothetical protein